MVHFWDYGPRHVITRYYPSKLLLPFFLLLSSLAGDGDLDGQTNDTGREESATGGRQAGENDQDDYEGAGNVL